jgi:hypothetical protein
MGSKLGLCKIAPLSFLLVSLQPPPLALLAPSPTLHLSLQTPLPLLSPSQ